MYIYSIRLVIDHNKVKRAQKALATEIRQDFEEDIKKNGVSCIFFDGRQDDAKVMMEWGDGGKQFPVLIKCLSGTRWEILVPFCAL